MSWTEKMDGLPWTPEALFNGDRDAWEVFHIILSVTDVWDDLVDRDRQVTSEQINHAFIALFHDLQRNPFYIKWQAELVPLITTGIMCWLTANLYQKEQDAKGLDLAYGLRVAIAQAAFYVIYICHGCRIETAMKFAPAFFKDICWDSPTEYRRTLVGVK